MPDFVLQIDGEVEQPLELRFADLAGIDEAQQVRDVSRLQPGRSGDAVTLKSLLARARPKTEATHVTLHASADGFAASVPLDDLEDAAVVVYQRDGRPLEAAAGGPCRIVIPNSVACRTGELDACANVKFIDRIELSAGKGRDRR